MRLTLALAALMITTPVWAAQGEPGWYLVMIIPSGKVTVNQSPFGSEEYCRKQLAAMRSIVADTIGECVDLEPPR